MFLDPFCKLASTHLIGMLPVWYFTHQNDISRKRGMFLMKITHRVTCWVFCCAWSDLKLNTYMFKCISSVSVIMAERRRRRNADDLGDGSGSDFSDEGGSRKSFSVSANTDSHMTVSLCVVSMRFFIWSVFRTICILYWRYQWRLHSKHC